MTTTYFDLFALIFVCSVYLTRACVLLGVFVSVEAIAVAAGCVMAARVLHETALNRILRAPMSYFDTTPLGRIINRFSKDMDMVDFNMQHYLRAWLLAVAHLLSTLVVISYTTPYFLLIALPLGVVFYILQVKMSLVLFNPQGSVSRRGIVVIMSVRPSVGQCKSLKTLYREK